MVCDIPLVLPVNANHRKSTSFLQASIFFRLGLKPASVTLLSTLSKVFKCSFSVSVMINKSSIYTVQFNPFRGIHLTLRQYVIDVMGTGAPVQPCGDPGGQDKTWFIVQKNRLHTF